MVYNYEEKADLRKSSWNSKLKLGVTMHLSKIIELQFGKNTIHCLVSETYSDLLRRARSPSLYQRALQNIVTLMFKVKNGLVPSYIREIYESP